MILQVYRWRRGGQKGGLSFSPAAGHIPEGLRLQCGTALRDAEFSQGIAAPVWYSAPGSSWSVKDSKVYWGQRREEDDWGLRCSSMSEQAQRGDPSWTHEHMLAGKVRPPRRSPWGVTLGKHCAQSSSSHSVKPPNTLWAKLSQTLSPF
ncbi:hypothetical protein AGOR_G00045040 [Albula goreensis]|uniref:Uncharacterized protein n=1 Tax=Albula goreensis TaxID=1534307 RepID=A0A8T3E3B6_9TELE|nr:hypothetical protein AGOR_G00045040 [Albula goreensis]